MRKNYFSYFSFQIFFGFWAKNFSDFSRKLQEVVKTTFCVSRGTLCDFNFFKKFWRVLDLLQKPLAWFSNFYLCVQSKNSGRKIFFSSLQSFFGFWAKFLQTFGQRTSRSCQNYPVRVQTNNFWLEIFFKTLNCFGFSAETFGMVLKNRSKCPE